MVFTKRLWAVRESFLLIDFSSPNKTVACVKSMFVDCIKANNFWKCDEVRSLNVTFGFNIKFSLFSQGKKSVFISVLWRQRRFLQGSS